MDSSRRRRDVLPIALLSAANMALKLGQSELARREYVALLSHPTAAIGDKVRGLASEKLEGLRRAAAAAADAAAAVAREEMKAAEAEAAAAVLEASAAAAAAAEGDEPVAEAEVAAVLEAQAAAAARAAEEEMRAACVAAAALEATARTSAEWLIYGDSLPPIGEKGESGRDSPRTPRSGYDSPRGALSRVASDVALPRVPSDARLLPPPPSPLSKSAMTPTATTPTATTPMVAPPTETETAPMTVPVTAMTVETAAVAASGRRVLSLCVLLWAGCAVLAALLVGGIGVIGPAAMAIPPPPPSRRRGGARPRRDVREEDFELPQMRFRPMSTLARAGMFCGVLC